MRYLRYLFLAVIAILLISVSLANRDVVMLKLLPPVIVNMGVENYEITLPLFVVVFGGILAGLVIGFAWEWLREAKHRATATKATRKASQLEKELHKLKGDTGNESADVLALLEDTGSAK
ncbi:MAG: LapA family protein [Halocynthiibacter sp.]